MFKSRKTIIFGKNGFLGTHLHQNYQNEEGFYFASRCKNNKLIITSKNHPIKELPWNHEALSKIVYELSPQVVINAIALTNAELCEKSPMNAEQANSEIPLVLAIASSKVGARLIQISTDAVFGQKGSFFREVDEPHPKSVYGRTKLQGELAVMKYAPKHLIVRTNFFGYHESRPTLFNFFYQNLQNQRPVEGYEDVIFNPIYVKDLVRGLERFIEVEAQGILHFAGDEVLSKFDFGNRIELQVNPTGGLLSSSVFGDLGIEGYRKSDLTLSSEIRESLFNCSFDVNSGIRDAILDVKADENE